MISTTSSAIVNYYEVLGLNEKNCSANDVKKAYRKMALRRHPDKNPANHEEAVGRFEKISEAYQILSDSQSRETYDRYRCASAAAEENASTTPSTAEREQQRSRLATELRLVRLKPAQQVFEDFFGGRNPFSDMFGCNAGSELLYCKSGKGDVVNETPTRRWFPCLDDLRQRPTPNDKAFTLPAFSEESTPTKEHPNDSLNSSANAATVTSCVRQVSTSTRLSNGKKIVTRKVTENGVETVTIEENGKLTKKTVNGTPVNTDADDQPKINS